MEQCPVEVWQRILALACTDGGYTGCSLSLVSRFTRDAVEPIRFHSVMLIGRERCTAFATLMDHSSTQKTIRHLFVHWKISPSDPGFPGERDDVTKTLTSILSHVRPTLITLFLHDTDLFSICHCKLQFPVLKDLAVPTLSSFNLDPELDYPFPALERLHAYRCYNYHGLDQWVDIATLTPTISSLKLSAVHEDTTLPKFLRVLLGMPAPELEPIPGGVFMISFDDCFVPGSEVALRAEAIVGYLRHLKHVTLEPWEFTDDGWLNGEMLASLENVSSMYSPRDDGDVKLCVLPEKESYTVAEARADWLEVVEGGDGQWPPGTSQGSQATKVFDALPKRSEVLSALKKHSS